MSGESRCPIKANIKCQKDSLDKRKSHEPAQEQRNIIASFVVIIKLVMYSLIGIRNPSGIRNVLYKSEERKILSNRYEPFALVLNIFEQNIQAVTVYLITVGETCVHKYFYLHIFLHG